MKLLGPHKYLRLPKIDGVTLRFPVSEHVLVVGAKMTVRKTPLLHRSASFVFTAALCVTSFGLTFGSLNNTLSYFRDDETSQQNAFAAGLLAFRVNPGDVTIPIKQSDVVNLSPLFEPKPDSFDIKYRVRAEVSGGDSPLCSLLQAHGTSTPYVYSGVFRDMITEPATTTGHGYFEVSLPNAAGIPNGTTCTIALKFTGWYVGAEENTGYTDSHEDTFTFVYETTESPEASSAFSAPSDTPPASDPAAEESTGEETAGETIPESAVEEPAPPEQEPQDTTTLVATPEASTEAPPKTPEEPSENPVVAPPTETPPTVVETPPSTENQI